MSRKWCKGSKFVFKITESRARRKLTVLWGNVLFALGESLFPCSANLEVIQHRVEKIVGCQPISSIRGRKYAVKHHYWGTSKSMQIGKEVFYLLSWFSAHLLSLQVFRYWPTRKHGLIKTVLSEMEFYFCTRGFHSAGPRETLSYLEWFILPTKANKPYKCNYYYMHNCTHTGACAWLSRMPL